MEMTANPKISNGGPQAASTAQPGRNLFDKLFRQHGSNGDLMGSTSDEEAHYVPTLSFLDESVPLAMNLTLGKATEHQYNSAASLHWIRIDGIVVTLVIAALVFRNRVWGKQGQTNEKELTSSTSVKIVGPSRYPECSGAKKDQMVGERKVLIESTQQVKSSKQVHKEQENRETARQEERIQNVLTQNSLLLQALEDQRVTIQKINLEMQCRDEYVAKLEMSHGRTLKDLSAQLLVLSQQRDWQERQKEAEAAEQVALARQVEALAQVVEAQGRDWMAVDERQEAIREELLGQIQAVGAREATKERDQNKEVAKCLDETEQANSQVQKLSLQVEAIEKDLQNRTAQMAQLGQFLKARYEREDVKSGNLEQQCDTLASKMQSLTQDVLAQQVQTTSLQGLVQANSQESARWWNDIEGEREDDRYAQAEVLRSLSEAHKAALEAEIQGLRRGLQQQVAGFLEESQVRHLQCETGIESLRGMCRSQAEKADGISSRLQEVGSEMVTRRDVEESLRSSQQAMMFRVESFVQGVELKNEEELATLRAFLEKQISELNGKIHTSQDRQDARMQQLQAKNDSKVETLLGELHAYKQDFQSLSDQGLGLDRLAKVEAQYAALAEQLEEVTEMQEHIDIEFMTHKTDYGGQLSTLRKALKFLEEQHERLRVASEEASANASSQTEVLRGSVDKCSMGVQELRRIQDTVDTVLDSLKSKTLVHEQALCMAKDDQVVTLSKLNELSAEYREAAALLSSSEQVIRDAKEELSSRIGETETKLEHLESQMRRDVESRNEQRRDLVQKVEHLSVQVHEQNESSFELQEEVQMKAAELGKVVEDLKGKIDAREKSQAERLGEVVNRVGKVEEDLAGLVDSVDCIKGEVEENRSSSEKANLGLNAEYVGTGQHPPLTRDVSCSEKEDSDVGKESPVSASQHADDTAQTLSESEAQYVNLCTKLIAFNGELQRRVDRVAALEKLTKDKSDAFSSRVGVLNREIEEQRRMLKRWTNTVQKNRTRLKEAQLQLGHLAHEVKRCQDELCASDERVSDIDEALKEEGVCESSRFRLNSQLVAQEKHRDEWKKQVEALTVSFTECESECIKLSSKHQLFEEELGRRYARRKALSHSLSNVFELVAVEREALHNELIYQRREREIWMEKVSELSVLIQMAEKDCPDAELFKAFPVVGQARAVLIEESDSTQSKDYDHEEKPLDEPAKRASMEKSLEDVEKQQRAALSETKETLEHKIEVSNIQCLALSKTVERISNDLESTEKLAMEVAVLKSDVASSENQMGRFKEEQMSLKTDLLVQIDSLKSKLQGLENRHQTSNVPITFENQGTSSNDLSARVEELAAKFTDHGKLVAQVGALADSIQKCEDRLSCYEEKQDDTKADVSAMIDFFKSDLQSLKELFEQSLVSKEADFSGLLSKVESLMEVSQTQGLQLEAVEEQLQKDQDLMQKQKSSAHIQTEHLVQQMNEKYIDLAAKVDLLSSEVSSDSQRQDKLVRNVKDREALYLAQLNAVRQDLASQQSMYQDQIQTRIYHAMVYLLRYVDKRQGKSALFPAWNSQEESLALKHRGDNAGSRGDDNDRALTRTSGYSMVSGIIRDNMFLPVMLTPSISMATRKKEKRS